MSHKRQFANECKTYGEKLKWNNKVPLKLWWSWVYRLFKVQRLQQTCSSLLVTTTAFHKSNGSDTICDPIEI